MPEINYIVALVLHSIFFFIGLAGNLFILVVNFLDWLKTNDLSPCDLILNSIGLSNIILQGIVVVNEFCFFMFPKVYSHDWVVNSFVVIISSVAFSSLWFSTCLCFYYCVKIVNLNGAFFYKLKTKVPTMMPWLLVGSIAISWTMGLPAYWDLYREFPLSVAANFSGNWTSSLAFSFKSKCTCLFQLYLLFSSVAFTIVFSSGVAIITSLCKHMRRMRKNNEGFASACLDSHLAAVKTVTSLLILYIMFYGALNAIFNSSTAVGSLLFSLCIMGVSSFPSINSIILIMGNTKLTKALRQLLGGKQCGQQ
ncbi:hypothetical protein FKM82_014789 [Ascaphus truei]